MKQRPRKSLKTAVVGQREIQEHSNVPRKKITLSERVEIAKGLYDTALANGVDYINYSGGFSGDLSVDKNEDGNPALCRSAKWHVDDYGDIHLAGLLPTPISGYKYIEKAKDYEIDYNNNYKALIELSRKTTRYEGIVATGIEALCEIPTLGGWYIDCEDEEMRKSLVWWCENLGAIEKDENLMALDHVPQIGGVEQFSIKILWGMYEDGDKIITEKWDKVLVPSTGKRLNVPTKFFEHDVLECEIDETAAKMGLEVIKVKIDPSIIEVIKKNSSELTITEEVIINNIHPEIIDRVRTTREDMIELPPAFTSHFSRKNNMRETRGVPFTLKCFPALAYKHRLRALDNSTIDGLIQRVWIIKLGVEDKDSPMHYPSNDRVLLAVAAFKNLKTNNFLIWPGPDLTKEELASSEQNVLSFSDRYNSADEDILYSLGIPRLILDGTSSGTQSRDWSVFVKTLSQMERYQIMLKRWLESRMRQICIQNGKKDLHPKFYWMMMKMQDREKSKNIVTKLRELSLLPARRSLYLLGLPGVEIMEEMIREKEEKLHEKTYVEPPAPTAGRPPDTPDGDGDDPNNKNKNPEPDSNRNNSKE